MQHVPTIFQQLRQTNESREEYWSARDLAKVLEYDSFRNFETALIKAQESCKNSGQSIKKHFVDINKMIDLGKTASREIKDLHLSRYACYLVMQNADPSKEIVALGQTYFAIQTRRQELQDQAIEDHKRVFLRGEVTSHNKHLAETASKAGVKNHGVFTNYGYKGLYGGLDSKQIHTKKKLKKHQQILDHMGSEELAANLFRATQADAKLQRENIQGEAKANHLHFDVGRKVRQTIKELGGTMPEKLSIQEHIDKAKRRLKKSDQVEFSNKL